MTVARTPVSPASGSAADAKLDALREGLLEAVRLLKARQARAIPVAVIDGCVERNWLEWRGGGLFLTITGENVCRQGRTPPSS